MNDDRDSKPRFRPGDRFYHTPYVIVAIIGIGYSAEVYRVRHLHTGVERALKVSHLKDARHVHKTRRSLNEAQTAIRLDHGNVVKGYESGCEDDGTVWLLLELLEGVDLDTFLTQRGRLSPRLALFILEEVAWGINEAHENRVIHRDLKPANVFVCNNMQIKLLDFSVAKLIDDPVRTTSRFRVEGTLAYMAPEQVRGLKSDARVDIFSLGTMGYRMLKGVHPFEEHLGDMFELGRAQMFEEPASLKLLPAAYGVTEKTVAIVQKAMAKDRDERYFDIAQMAQDLGCERRKWDKAVADRQLMVTIPDGEPVITLNTGRREYHPPERTFRTPTEPLQPAERVELAKAIEPKSPAPAGSSETSPDVPAAVPQGALVPQPVRARAPGPHGTAPLPEELIEAMERLSVFLYPGEAAALPPPLPPTPAPRAVETADPQVHERLPTPPGGARSPWRPSPLDLPAQSREGTPAPRSPTAFAQELPENQRPTEVRVPARPRVSQSRLVAGILGVVALVASLTMCLTLVSAIASRRREAAAAVMPPTSSATIPARLGVPPPGTGGPVSDGPASPSQQPPEPAALTPAPAVARQVETPDPRGSSNVATAPTAAPRAASSRPATPRKRPSLPFGGPPVF